MRIGAPTGLRALAKSRIYVAGRRCSSVVGAHPTPSSRLALLVSPRFRFASQTGRRSLHALVAIAIALIPTRAAAQIDPHYPDAAAIDAALDELAAAHPSARTLELSEVYALPSAEGRMLRALRLGRGTRPVLVVAGLHGRELAPPVTALALARALVEGDGLDRDITALLDDASVYIAPMWNPDGYAHVRAADPEWRKNRSPQGSEIGVDLNRNFDVGWDGACAGDRDPASRFYKGERAGSERETELMTRWAGEIGFDAVLDLHASGPAVVFGRACGDSNGDLARELSERLGYGGASRRASGDGELHQWFAAHGARVSLLIELGTEQRPAYDDAVAEADRVIPAIVWALGEDAVESNAGCSAGSRPGGALVLLALVGAISWPRRPRPPRRYRHRHGASRCDRPRAARAGNRTPPDSDRDRASR
jgi:predicted deacylase